MPRPCLQILRLCALTICACAHAFSADGGAAHPGVGDMRAGGGDVRAAAAPQRRSRRSRTARRAMRGGRAHKRCEGDGIASGKDAGMSKDNFDALMRRARTAGAVAVVVRLCVPFRPEGELSEEAARLQRAAIARAQDELLKELRRFGVNSVKRFEYTPFVALTADAEALLRLRSSTSVADVTEDAAAPATNE